MGQATLTHSPAHRQAAMAPPERYRRSQHRYPGGERRARTPPKQRHVRRRRHTSTETITAPNERTHRQRCSRATQAHEQRVELVVDVPSEVRHRLHYPSERTQSPGVVRNRRRPQVQRSVGGRRRRRLETGQSVRVCVPYHGSFLRCRQSALAGAPRFALSPAMLGERGNCTSRDRFGGPGGWRPVQPVTHRLLRHASIRPPPIPPTLPLLLLAAVLLRSFSATLLLHSTIWRSRFFRYAFLYPLLGGV